MKILRSKSKVSTVALVLVLTIAATLVALPIVNAQSAAYKDSYIYISARPNPAGVGQTVLVVFWTAEMPRPETIEEEAAGVRGGWYDVSLIVTKPDGTTQTIVHPKSDPVGGGYEQYTPDTTGTYYFQASFPGQWRNTTTTQTYYKSATSEKLELTVTQEPIEPYPDWPLPEDYWYRPIEAENRDWWQISGNWLMSNYNASKAFNPYTKAPNTAHIVWTKEIAFGGIIGGEYGSTSYYGGQSYESKWAPVAIMNGRLYYNTLPSRATWALDGAACVDIRTGETLWWKNGTTFSFGQIYDYESPNQHGGIPYLWGTVGSTYKMYDAFSGDWILDIENVPSGTRTFSPDGSILVYTLSGATNTLQMWNSSRIEGMLAGTTGTSFWQWRPPQGATLNGTTGIQWKVSVPDVPGSQSIRKISPSVIYARTTFTLPNLDVVAQDVAYSIKPGDEGRVLWGPINRTAQPSFPRRSGSMQDGVFAEYIKEKMEWYAYDISTGKQIWGPTEPRGSWASYDPGEGDAIAYGKLYSAAYDGCIYAYDLETGKHLWTYFTGSSGTETPYGHWPFPTGSGGDRFAIADHKIFAQTSEHSPSQPMLRGYKLHVIDTETGLGVWNITGWYLNPAVADGYLVIFNQADNRLYGFGKGHTATTVSATPGVITEGSSVMIQGTVTDQTPEAKGTPAISDEYMTQWMEYLYMQKPCPADAKGVEVTLDAVDPNGNWIHIGRVTSDMSGMFKKMWTPDIEGEYTIIATFEGSESYYASYVETAIGVGPAPEEPTEPATPAGVQEDIDRAIDSLTPMFLGIIVAVVVAIILVVYDIIDRKRK